MLRILKHQQQHTENELPKKILWTNPGCQWGCGWPKSRWIDRI